MHQRPVQVPLGVQEPQQRTQRLHRALCRGVRLARVGRHNERDDRRPVEPIKLNPRRSGKTLQERPDVHRVAMGRFRQQAALEHQISLIALQQLLDRVVQHGRLRSAMNPNRRR
jgi:hypothetical protein